MRMEERAPSVSPEDSPAIAPWRPAYQLTGEDGIASYEPRLDDLYAAVDDIADGMVVLRLSLWPALDAEGRLTFGGDPSSWALPAPRLQAVAEAERIRHGQLAPDRPLRVGDVFALRGARTSLAITTADALLGLVLSLVNTFGGVVGDTHDHERGSTTVLEIRPDHAEQLVAAVEGATDGRARISVVEPLLIKELVDVSAAARDAAKAAYYGAAASTMEEGMAEAMGLTAPPEPPAERGVFDVRMVRPAGGLQ
jgi:hypothetical protein